MKNNILVTAVLLLILLFVAACSPTENEPEGFDRIPTRFVELTSSPSAVEATPAVSPTPALNLPGDVVLRPAEVPASLPIYMMQLENIPENREEALAWAAEFGLTNVDVREENEEAIILGSLNGAGDQYEELTFLRTPYNYSIIYSSGIFGENISGPTSTPNIEVPFTLPPEMVIETALAFVREHNLLPEPLIAHEIPGAGGDYSVHVSFSPEGLRLTGIGIEPGVRVRIDRSDRVVEARIVQADFARAELTPITPIEQIYPAYIQGELRNDMFNERGQFGSLRLDPMRFQVHSLPYGDQGDRVELVYAPLPTQPERVVPMWLITRPHEQSWDHYDEYYLAATTGVDIPAPRPSSTPLAHTDVVPESFEIVSSLVIESEDGRIFTNAVIDGITQTVSLDAVTGDLIAVFGLTGDLALDDGRNQLYVDKYPHGLTVIDTTTGEFVNDMQLPAGESGHAHLQADPATGNVLLFRDQMVLVADPLSQTWQQTIPMSVEGTVCGEPMEEPLTIDQTWFDEEARLLYLSFISYVCTPWVSYTVMVYDLNSMSEVARYPEIDPMSGLAVNGRFYGKSWFRMGQAFQFGWQNGQPWLEQTERGEDIIGAFSGFELDENRGWLYEMTVEGLQVLDMETMAVVKTVASPVDGQLVGFDRVTDNLYFVAAEDGRLVVWSAENIQN